MSKSVQQNSWFHSHVPPGRTVISFYEMHSTSSSHRILPPSTPAPKQAVAGSSNGLVTLPVHDTTPSAAAIAMIEYSPPKGLSSSGVSSSAISCPSSGNSEHTAPASRSFTAAVSTRITLDGSVESTGGPVQVVSNPAVITVLGRTSPPTRQAVMKLPEVSRSEMAFWAPGAVRVERVIAYGSTRPD